MRAYLDRLAECRVTVFGDLMLDRYMNGSVSRISPEAPVPVVKVETKRAVPGGAANVAVNLATLGVRARLIGVVGDDKAREQLLAALSEHNVDCSGVITDSSRETTQKLRVIGAHQQIVRVDREDTTPLSAAVQAACLAEAVRGIVDADVLVVSDYGKGVCSAALLADVFETAAAAGVPSVVDPKHSDLSIYRGATIVTPNRKELSGAVQLPCETDHEAELACRKAQEATRSALLLTRSEKGMSYYPLTGDPVHFATAAQDVFDVSGAGDTVVAVLAAVMAAGIPMLDGVKMANHAAGIVVSKLGTASVTRGELATALAAEDISVSADDGRLLILEDAVALRHVWGRERLSVGVANGCFDLLHPGHVSLIREAAANCDRLIVAVNSDASVRRLKGPGRPVQSESARAAVMGRVKGVAAVVLFEEDTPLALIKALQPDILVKGSDYAEDEVVGADVVRARGGRIVLVNLLPDQSTSQLVDRARLMG